jgi:hypothetical protein
MNTAFLLLSLLMFVPPIILHLVSGVLGNGNFKRIIWVSLGHTIVFSSFTGLLKLMGVLSFDYHLTTNIIFRTLPIEQYLLHFGFCFFALTLYQFLNSRFPDNTLQKFSLAASNLILGLCVAFLFFAYDKWYTILAFSLLLITIFLIEYLGKLRFMFRAYRLYLIMLIPFYLVYGILVFYKVIIFNGSELAGLYMFKVPVETSVVFLVSLLIPIYMLEFFKIEKNV